MDTFRQRTTDAAQRVAERTGVDPLDLDRSMAVTADSRLELLRGSIGIGAGLMSVAAAVVGASTLVAPSPQSSDGGQLGVGLGLIGTAAAFAVVVLTTVVVARAARTRRPTNELYEDAWARLAVELWPVPRYQGFGTYSGTAASYSRTEFLIAVRDGADLERFARHAPFTRNP